MTKTVTLIKGEKEKTFSLRLIKKEEIKDCLALQETVVAGIGNRALFEPLTEEELSESVALDTVAALFDGENMAAFCMLIHNRDTDRSLADDDGKRRESVLTFDGVLVLPDYRGYGIQRLFLDFAEEKARRLGAMHILATVAPQNPHSRRNFEKQGFSVIKEYKKYGGYPRLLVCKSVR